MALVDCITIKAAAGKGGDGVVRWLHIKGKEKGGPSGGDGGRGGNIVFRAVRDLGVLARYKGKTQFRAQNGESGGSDKKHGADGASIYIEVPVGSVVTQGRGDVFELLSDGQEVIALKGGNGGYGNDHFKSSTNINPYEAVPGQQGESDTFRIELKIIADAGLVGLPNAGKSSLLNALTRAQAKVGDYPFTTLEPNLGVLYNYVIADIPGLIEGAAEGKGLGHEFLKHIERTRGIVHLVALDGEDPVKAYSTVRAELKSYNAALVGRPELIFLTKSDTVDAGRVDNMKLAIAGLAAPGATIEAITVLDDAVMKTTSDTLVQFLQQSV
ncbi:MAG: GTPase ObgE [Patescibacteria group bacterium]